MTDPQIFPERPEAGDLMIDLLYRHFYRNWEDGDPDKPFLTFRSSDILATVNKHEIHQISADIDAALAQAGNKRKDGPGGSDDADDFRDRKRQMLRVSSVKRGGKRP